MNDQNIVIIEELFDELKKTINNVPYGQVNIQVRIHQGNITDYVYTPFIRRRTYIKSEFDSKDKMR